MKCTPGCLAAIYKYLGAMGFLEALLEWAPSPDQPVEGQPIDWQSIEVRKTDSVVL
jgi:hypothetical protein